MDLYLFHEGVFDDKNLSLASISFINTKVCKLAKNFLLSTKEFLRIFRFEKFPIDLNLDMIFANSDFAQLTDVEIHSEEGHLRTIAASNFTAFSAIQKLNVSYCGIEMIEEKAFDFISRTICKLDLTGNRLKTVSAYIFNKIIGRKSSQAVEVNISENLLECNCDLLELSSVAFWHSRDLSKSIFEPQIKCSTAANQTAEQDRKCENLQVINAQKLGLTHLKKDKYFYPKFSIHVQAHESNYTLIIKTPGTVRFRLWVHSFADASLYKSKLGYSDKRCPRKGFLETSATCLLFAGEKVHVPLNNLLENSRIRMISVSYVHGGQKKMFWPLHCISYGRIAQEDSGLRTFLTIMAVSSAVGIVFGIAGALLRQYYKSITSKKCEATATIVEAVQKGEKG